MDDCYQVNMRWNLTFRFGSPFIEGLTLESLLKPAPEWAALHPQSIYIPPQMGTHYCMKQPSLSSGVLTVRWNWNLCPWHIYSLFLVLTFGATQSKFDPLFT